MSIIGANLAGTSTTRVIVENDFYATPTWATEAILNRERLQGTIWEPACGQGHISKVLHRHYPNAEITSTDLINRGYGVGGVDFLSDEVDSSIKYITDNIITNPPFSLAQEFIERALSLATKKVIMFAKIQLLEGEKRRKLFDKFPPKYVYVFTKRVTPLNNGTTHNEFGKPWASTMCFAWFVWEKGFKGEPTIRWI